jgi:hypothetical protein
MQSKILQQSGKLLSLSNDVIFQVIKHKTVLLLFFPLFIDFSVKDVIQAQQEVLEEHFRIIALNKDLFSDGFFLFSFCKTDLIVKFVSKTEGESILAHKVILSAR